MYVFVLFVLYCTGCSKLLENGDEGGGEAPMFRTGLGKSVVLKQSSIAKALSVLGDDDAVNSGAFLSLYVICLFINFWLTFLIMHNSIDFQVFLKLLHKS